MGVVSAGTSIGLSSGQRVCTNTNSVGDRITATTAEAVTGSNGVVIPAGATAVLEVTSLGRSGQAGENMITLAAGQLGGMPFPYLADWTERVAKGELPFAKPTRPPNRTGCPVSICSTPVQNAYVL